MDLNKLDRVVAIYDAGSFRKAAKELGLTQPALTWSIQNLEEQLNTRLFERGPRGIRATQACEKLVTRARLILREQGRIMEDFGNSSVQQTINLGVHSILLTPDFAHAVSQFTNKWPAITLRMREGFSSDLLERLQRGELDLVCCALPQEQDYGGTLISEPLAKLKYSVVAHRDHPIFQDIEAGRAIASYRWAEFDVALMGSFPSDDDVAGLMSGAGGDTARKSVRTTSMNMIRLLIREGEFIGFIADALVADELETGQLRRIPGTGVTAASFGLVSVKDDFATSAVAELRSLLANAAFASIEAVDD